VTHCLCRLEVKVQPSARALELLKEMPNVVDGDLDNGGRIRLEIAGTLP